MFPVFPTVIQHIIDGYIHDLTLVELYDEFCEKNRQKKLVDPNHTFNIEKINYAKYLDIKAEKMKEKLKEKKEKLKEALKRLQHDAIHNHFTSNILSI